MNILTFDIEEWYVEKVWGGNSQSRYKQFDELLDLVLAELERRNTKATFFVELSCPRILYWEEEQLGF